MEVTLLLFPHKLQMQLRDNFTFESTERFRKGIAPGLVQGIIQHLSSATEVKQGKPHSIQFYLRHLGKNLSQN